MQLREIPKLPRFNGFENLSKMNERLSDELLALESIYPDARITSITNGDATFLVVFEDENIRLLIHLPSSYPESGCPICEIVKPCNASATRVAKEVGELTSSMDGEALFTLIDYCQENLGVKSDEVAKVLAIEAVQQSMYDEEQRRLDDEARISRERKAQQHHQHDVDADANEEEGDDELSASSNRKWSFINATTSAILPIHVGDTIVDRKSVFTGFYAIVRSREDAEVFKQLVLADRKVARATHNMIAYRIVDDFTHPSRSPVIISDNDEDGEAGAGRKMAETLEKLGVTKHVVMISRWYGGIPLGPDRFRHIAVCTRNTLEMHGQLAAAGGASHHAGGSGGGGAGKSGKSR